MCIPQTHPPGAEAEVDFGEFYVDFAGVAVKCWMFMMRLSHSGKAFHAAFGTQAQEAFLEGHVLAFDHFGGVPARIRYDNLKPARRGAFVLIVGVQMRVGSTGSMQRVMRGSRQKAADALTRVRGIREEQEPLAVRGAHAGEPDNLFDIINGEE